MICVMCARFTAEPNAFGFRAYPESPLTLDPDTDEVICEAHAHERTMTTDEWRKRFDPTWDPDEQRRQIAAAACLTDEDVEASGILSLLGGLKS